MPSPPDTPRTRLPLEHSRTLLAEVLDGLGDVDAALRAAAEGTRDALRAGCEGAGDREALGWAAARLDAIEHDLDAWRASLRATAARVEAIGAEIERTAPARTEPETALEVLLAAQIAGTVALVARRVADRARDVERMRTLTLPAARNALALGILSPPRRRLPGWPSCSPLLGTAVFGVAMMPGLLLTPMGPPTDPIGWAGVLGVGLTALGFGLIVRDMVRPDQTCAEADVSSPPAVGRSGMVWGGASGSSTARRP